MRSPLALWARLGAMSWDEIPHRMREQVRRRLDRRPAVPRGGAIPRWPHELALTVPEFSALWRAADAALLVQPQPWNLCPRTGHDWGSGYAFDIDFFAGVDPRASWALHRLRDLQLLAVAAGAGHARAEVRCRERVLSWIRENPPMAGIGWATGIEVACRAASLVLIADTAAGAWSEADRQLLSDAIAAHAWYLERYPSVGSSLNNHAVAELGARVLLGQPLEERFSSALVAMVRPDGSGVEEAPHYLAACVEWALLVRSSLTPAALDRLALACRFLGGLVDGVGRSPSFGDSDGDALLSGPTSRLIFEVAGLAASALERPDLCPVGWTPGVRGVLLGIGIMSGQRAVETTEVGGGIARLVRGLAVAWVDRGALGMAPMAAHGHADALSVVLHMAGKPVLIDAGTGTYLGDLVWRRWCRGAAAHNGLVVDGKDPIPQQGPFQWAPEPPDLWESTWLDAAACEAGGRWRGWTGLVHQRRVVLSHDSVAIYDRVEGKGKRWIALPLYIAPGVRAPAEVDCDGLQTALRGQRVALSYGVWGEATCVWSEGEVALPWEGQRVVRFS